MGRPRRGITAADRIFSLVSVDDVTGCWLWHGYRMPFGHGRVRVGGRKVLVHRWVYEHLVGPIPPGLVLDHLCRVPACCNPEHLDPVTNPENVNRSPLSNANKTSCPQGHPYDAENTRVYGGSRYCVACQRARYAA